MLKIFRYFFFITIIFSIFELYSLERVKFRKYETDHQIIYFSSNLSDGAVSRLIKQAKRSEEFIEALYGWVPKKKIVTVYDRETDTANGWSRSYLKNTMFLYTFPAERYSELNSYKSWEQGLHVHEYTHATQIGMTKGFPKFINTVFGNIYFPGGMAPRWMLEGAAVYSESLIDGKGRLNSPLYKAQFDSFFLKGNELTIGELSGISDHWMGGGLQYLFGTYFYAYLVENKGKKAVSDLFVELSDDVIPFMVQWASKKTLHSRLSSLYKDFINENKARVSGANVSKSGIYKSKERFVSVFAELNSDKYIFSGTGLVRRKIYSFEKGETKKIVSMPSHNSFSYLNGHILVPLSIRVGDRYIRNEVFYMDLKKRSIKKLTENESAVETAFGRNDDYFYSSYRDGVNRITHSKLDGTLIKEWEFRQLDSIYSISVSKDGSRLVFSGNIYDREKNIFFFDIKNNELTEVQIPGDQYSVYFQSDDEIVFSSELESRIVPMSLNLKTGDLIQLYRPELITLFPKLIDGNIHFISFDNDGYFSAWGVAERIELGKISEDKFVKVKVAEAEKEGSELKRAKFYEGMFPALIIPNYSGSSNSHTLGFTISGESNDMERSYDISYSKTWGGSDRHYAVINYYDSSIWPGFRWYFSYGREEGKIGGNYVTHAAYNRFNSGFSLSSSLNYPVFICPSKVVSMNHSIGTSFGISGTQIEIEKLKDPLEITPFIHDKLSLAASFYYGFSFSLNPGSYYLFSDMDRFSMSFPVAFHKSLFDDGRSISFSPSGRLSFLLLPNGKLGFLTKHSLYLRFLTDSYYVIGGNELGTDILNLNTFIYGGSSSVTVRGYNYGAFGGQHIYFTNNEFRFHLLSIERGLGTVPLMFKNVQGSIFFDLGVASPDINMFDDQFIAGIGGELKLYTVWWYRVPIMFTFGTAYGLTAKGQLNFYFSLGNSF
ncbi:MAG TPA: hypothetical protein PKG52_10495 [bacterium]|nr:hypothetical protein [bacterium]HPS30232.1 hypothetical protein [bacterium]